MSTLESALEPLLLGLRRIGEDEATTNYWNQSGLGALFWMVHELSKPTTSYETAQTIVSNQFKPVSDRLLAQSLDPLAQLLLSSDSLSYKEAKQLLAL